MDDQICRLYSKPFIYLRRRNTICHCEDAKAWILQVWRKFTSRKMWPCELRIFLGWAKDLCVFQGLRNPLHKWTNCLNTHFTQRNSICRNLSQLQSWRLVVFHVLSLLSPLPSLCCLSSIRRGRGLLTCYTWSPITPATNQRISSSIRTLVWVFSQLRWATSWPLIPPSELFSVFLTTFSPAGSSIRQKLTINCFLWQKSPLTALALKNHWITTTDHLFQMLICCNDALIS